MTSVTTIVTLIVMFIQLGENFSETHRERMSSVDECFDVAREFAAQAEDIQIRLGGTLTASCEVKVMKSEDH